MIINESHIESNNKNLNYFKYIKLNININN